MNYKTELRQGMIAFRKYAIKVAKGRKGIQKTMGESWSEVAQASIYRIAIELDIDYVSGTSDIFMSELKNANTKLTWASYSQYYVRMRKGVLLKKKFNSTFTLEDL